MSPRRLSTKTTSGGAAGGIQVVAGGRKASFIEVQNELKAAWDALEALWGKPSPHWNDQTGTWVYK